VTGRLGDSGLLACHHTISGVAVGQPARHSFRDRAEAAAAAGLTGIGLTAQDFAALRADGTTAEELRRIADGSGVTVTELEFLNGWWAEGERLAADRRAEEVLYELAAALGIRHINVGASVSAAGAPDTALLADRFGAICDRAAAHGLLVGLEYTPFFVLADIASAWEIVCLADRPNGGVVVDAFHHLRPGGLPADLRAVPPGRIVTVQLCDVPAEIGLSLLDEAMGARTWPGQGALDVPGLVRELDGMGATCPVGIEVLSPAVRALPAREAARLAADSARRVLAAAGPEPVI
jgi:sugar phosphate isomerase/epimerase